METQIINSSFYKALLKREGLFRSLLDKSNLLLFVFNEAEEITYMCDYAPKVLHKKQESFVGHSLFEVFPAKNKATITEAKYSLKGHHNKTQKITDIQIKTLEGELRFFDGTITNLVDDVEVGGYVVYICDVTERKLNAEKLNEANFELDNFIYRASHDMRAPLMSVVGLVDLAIAEHKEDPSNYLLMIKDSVLKLDRYLRDLTHYSSNERTEIAYQAFNPKELVAEVIADLSYHKNYASVSFEIVTDRDFINHDQGRLKTILTNLISNAVKFSTGITSPRIKVGLYEKGSGVHINVEDNGHGISEDVLPKIFEMFFRGSEKSDGAGLGLYITKKIVDKLNGKLELKSDFGRGTQVNVFIPTTSFSDQVKQLL